MEHYGSIQSSRIRKPPQTELETLSSTLAWVILLFPVFLSILTVLIDSNSTIHTKGSDINESRCPDYLNCKLSPGYLVLSFNKPPIIFNFVRMTAVLDPPALLSNASFFNEFDVINTNTNEDKVVYIHTTISSGDLNHYTHSLVYEKYASYNKKILINYQNHQHIIQLLDWSFDQPSLAGNKIFLTVNISFSQNIITNDMILSKLVIKTQRRDYLLVKCISMIALSVFTIAVIIYWLLRTISYINNSKQKFQKKFSLRILIAEQIYTLILLFFILLWQGGPYAVTLLLILYQSSRSDISDKLLFTVGVMRDIGQQGIYFIFLILADGLHCSDTSFHQSLQLKKTLLGNDTLLNPTSTTVSRGSRRTGAPEWTYEESKSDSHTCSSSSSISNRATFSGNWWSKSSMATKGIYNQIDDSESSATRLPAHHPSSPFVIDFLVWKTALFLTACLLVTVKRSLSFPHYFGYPWGDTAKSRGFVVNAFAVSSLLRVIVSLLWVILFLVAMSRTARQLRKDRYMTSRFRQMAWRLLMNQVFLGITIIGVTYAIQIYQLILLLAVDGRHREFHDVWEASMRLLSERFVSWAGEDTQLGELFYVSVVCYTITYVFSVPSLSSHSSEYSGTSHAWVALESELDVLTEVEVSKSYSIEMVPLASEGLLPPPRHRDSTRSSSKSTLPLPSTDQRNHQATAPFCLETSCFLLECTWQSYFPPEGISMYSPSDPLPNLLGTAVAANMDVKRLGLTLTKYLSDRVTDSWGYVASKRGRIVVCFRGTVGFMNIATDLKLTQTPLPRLKLSDSELLELLCLLRGSTRDRDEVLSNTDLYSVSSILQSMTDHTILEEAAYDHSDVEQPATHNNKSQPSEKKGKESVRQESIERNHTCLKSLLTKLPIAKQVLPRIHAGFWESYSTVRKDMMQGVTEAMFEHYASSNNNNNNGTKDRLEICVCGHSLGGAIAVLAALDISLNIQKLSKITSLSRHCSPPRSSADQDDLLQPSISLYTFGTPRVGNPTFARLVNRSIATYYRVETDGDFFVSIPKFLGTYRHAGIPVLVDSEKSGCLIVKPTVVEHHFFRQSGSSAACHALERYRDCLEACFESDELASYMSKEYEATTSAVKILPASSMSKSKPTGSGGGGLRTSSEKKKKTTTLPEWLITSR